MIDILITTHDRLDMLKKTVESLVAKLVKTEYRLFIADDCSHDGTREYLSALSVQALSGILLLRQRSGVVFAFNLLFNASEVMHQWDVGSEWVCYLQDDLVSEGADWPLTLIGAYEEMKDQVPIGFLSGYDAPEHPVRERVSSVNFNAVVKDSSTAGNLMAPREFWRSIGYVPRLNPDGSARGFPGNGRGSQIDLYWTGCMSQSRFVKGAAAVNCSYNQGKKVLVVPDLLTHIGMSEELSTWRNVE